MYSLIATDLPLYQARFIKGQIYYIAGPTGGFKAQYAYRDSANQTDHFWIKNEWVKAVSTHTGFSIQDSRGVAYTKQKLRTVVVDNNEINLDVIDTSGELFTLAVTGTTSFPSGGGTWDITVEATRLNGFTGSIPLTISTVEGITGTATIAVDPAVSTTLSLTVVNPSISNLSSDDIMIFGTSGNFTAVTLLKNPYVPTVTFP